MNSIKFKGQIKKMISEFSTPIQYYLDLKEDYLSVNQLIEKKIKIRHTHNQCLNCSLDKPIYRMGYCKSCFFEVPQTNESVIRPELSKAHLGVEQRNLEWEQQFELQSHIVYLAVSGGVKVGVTRETQIPTRWIDQGATEAIVLAKTDNRYEAGLIEVALKEYISDKTNYQKMLKNESFKVDLILKKEELKGFIPKELLKFYVNEHDIWEINYPVENYPTKITSINLAKQNEFEGMLTGIKGQYLMLDNQKVWNVRSHEGFYIEVDIL